MILFAAGRSEALKRFLVEDGFSAYLRRTTIPQPQTANSAR